MSQLTEDQKCAVEIIEDSLCVDAGAGSGKTSVLVARVVHLLDKRLATLDEVAAITFTDKAAAEMKERLRAAFREKAPPDDPGEMSRWRDMERRVETARISTIHSFCAALLRENALLIGMDPDFTVLAEAETAILRKETVTDTVHSLLEQGAESAVRAATESGTKRLIETLDAMLRKRAEVERFSEWPSDPGELAAHWLWLVEKEENRRFISLRHSPKLLRFKDELTGFAGLCSNPGDGREQLRLEMLDALDTILNGCEPAATRLQMECLARGLAGRRGSKKNWDPEQAFKDLTELQNAIKKMAGAYVPEDIDEAVERKSAQLTIDVRAVYGSAAAAYCQAKAERTGLDFDDLIMTTLATLRGNEPVRGRIARGIKFLLIDEFQDTDATQLELARLLSDHPGGPGFFFVGDAKQSIYCFRGAEVEVFRGEREQADKVVPLRRNFRSVPEVIEFVNDFFEGSGLLHAVEPAFHRMEVEREAAGGGRIEFLIPGLAEGAQVEDYRRAEADLIAGRIAAMCGNGDAQRPADYGGVAMIFRSMTSVAIYERALRQAGIPYNVVAGEGYYERQEILDVLNLLTVLVDPWDEAALLGFLRGPLAGLSDEALVELCAEGPLAQIFRSARTLDDPVQSERLVAARELTADLRASCEMPLPAFLRYVIERTCCEAICLSQFLGVQKAGNVRKLVDLAEDFARTARPNLAAFIHYVADVSGHGIRESDAPIQHEGSGAVTLMTIHKAKGLEFPIVIIPDAARGRRGPDARELVLGRALGMAARVTDDEGERAAPAIYDAIRKAQDEDDEAEHARVLYVAMTRARDWLLIGGAPKPRPSSWMHAFDAAFGVTALDDGATFSGDSGWTATVRRTRGKTRAPAFQQSNDELPAIKILERRAAPVVAASPGRRTFSVTELLGPMCGETEHEAFEPPATPGVVDPMLRGSIVHRMFELWDFQGEAPLDALLRREYPSLALWEAVAPGLREIAGRFVASPIGSRLASDTGLQRETPFLLRMDDALVSGTVDALLSDGTILDYKTGRRHAGLHAHYEWQLRLYAAAVTRLAGKHAPTAILYYVDLGEECEVDVRSERVEEALERASQAIRVLRERPG